MKRYLLLMALIFSSLSVAMSANDSPEKIYSYSEIEKSPEFPGGDEAMLQWIEQHMIYPEKALKKGTETNILVQFVVSADGTISEVTPKGMMGGDRQFADEATRLFQTMPKWNPATSNGKNVSSRCTKLVPFILKGKMHNPHVIMHNPYLYMSREPYKMSSVPRLPRYPGGPESMYRWISDNLVYPAEDVKAKIEGKVIVRFVISECGVVENPEIVHGLTETLNNEAIRLVTSMPRWEPGYSDGYPVKTYFILPVTFKLAKDK